jgi:hypothetical protein
MKLLRKDMSNYEFTEEKDYEEKLEQIEALITNFKSKINNPRFKVIDPTKDPDKRELTLRIYLLTLLKYINKQLTKEERQEVRKAFKGLDEFNYEHQYYTS